MRVVIALGGNALLRRDEPLTAEAQRRNVAEAARAVAEVAREHEVLVTHGNGPQVGLLALREEDSGTAGFPLDVLGAETEGMIGYLVAQELGNQLPERAVATLLTQVEVDPADPAFRTPSKPIGPTWTEAEAVSLAARRGWRIARDGDPRSNLWRRVVPSPEPLRILEVSTLRLLADHGVLVVCAGGGGIPVVFDPWGRVHGVEAVIDKDTTAALLARETGADALLLLTDVERVMAGWGTPGARPLAEATPSELRALDFAPGSMGPKVDAALRFVEETGGFAAIGALADAPRILAGEAGTRVLPEGRAGRAP